MAVKQRYIAFHEAIYSSLSIPRLRREGLVFNVSGLLDQFAQDRQQRVNPRGGFGHAFAARNDREQPPPTFREAQIFIGI